MPTSQSAVALPKWKCHKEVWADSIVEVRLEAVENTSGQVWVLECGGLIYVSDALLDRVPNDVSPKAGYYVRYADGFESWSPAKAFEDGYTRI